MLMKLPQLRDVRRTLLADFGIPEEVLEHMALKPQFDTRDTERALAGHGHRGARAAHVRDEALGLLGAHARSRPLQGPLVRAPHQRAHGRHHRRVERDRPGDGAEGRGRRRRPAARRARAREARGAARRDRGRGRHRARLQRRPVGHGRDRRGRRADARRPSRDRLPRQQRRPLDPPLDQALGGSLPRLRAHDPAQLLRRDQDDHGAAAAHARARLRPHRQRQLDRRADEPAALQRVRRIEVRARCLDARRRRRRSSATA